MLRKPHLTIAAALLLLGFTTSAHARGVNVKHAEADYGSWKTWSFVENEEKMKALDAAGQMEISGIIRGAISERLGKQGYRQVEEGETPDFRIDLDGTLREVFDVQDYHKQVSDHVAFVLEGGTSSYQEGTLLIRVLEGEGDRVVWTGWVTEEVRNPDRPERQIQRVVKRILKRFPPSQD